MPQAANTRNIYQTRPQRAGGTARPPVDLKLTEAKSITRNRMLAAGSLMATGLALAIYLALVLHGRETAKRPDKAAETFRPTNISLRDETIGYTGLFPLETNQAPLSLSGINIDQVFQAGLADATNSAGSIPAPLVELKTLPLLPLPGEDDLPGMLVSVASRFLKAGDYAEAENTLRKALEQRPDDLQALRMLGTVLLFQARHAEAETLFADLVRQDAFKADSFNHLGIARMHLGRLDEARQAFEQALRLNHEYADARLNLGLLHLMRRDHEKVAPLLAPLVTGDPSNPKLRRYLATAYFESGDPYQARLHLQELVRLTPDDAKPYFEIAHCYILQDQRQEALAWITLGKDKCGEAELKAFLANPGFEPLYPMQSFRREFGALLREP